MPTSQLRKLLDDNVGSGTFEMIIPHPLLPPRFRRETPLRNLILRLDSDLTLHIRWEGALRSEPHPLTPRAACHLIKEVLTKMTRYRQELRVFSRFVEEYGEIPFEEDLTEEPSVHESSQPEAKEVEARAEESEEIKEVEAYLRTSCRDPLAQMVGSHE